MTVLNDKISKTIGRITGVFSLMIHAVGLREDRNLPRNIAKLMLRRRFKRHLCRGELAKLQSYDEFGNDARARRLREKELFLRLKKEKLPSHLQEELNEYKIAAGIYN